ncbi:hypothetical protein K402DRAFT_389575 [Aulographum hederae CBS 113979]|uniref:HIG1 domain-containing protein n=1 Tax=Aulographum hederae CBS 113979 TaxID=1176131 RepID=A0A6G1HBP6_9PEZI|nr:hypothetical protein K402DRAFT_389575 [Aulographum hederae CBS 113979]
MKIISKEEEQEHYNATVRGGLTGGALGLAAGSAAVWAASRRFAGFRHLTIQFRAFLAVSTGTFASIIGADNASRAYEISRNPARTYSDSSANLSSELEAQKSTSQRLKDWAITNRYGIVFGSWVASMGAAGAIVSRNRYLTGQQKLVQARMYAQGLTIAVLVASFAIEGADAAKGKGRWETVRVLDPNDPTHKHTIEKRIHHERYAGEDQWRDMVEAEEIKIKEREESAKKQQEKEAAKAPKNEKKAAPAS